MATPIPANQARLSVWSAAAATRGRVVNVREGSEVAVGVTTDTRAVVPGAAFVALRGDRFDGHDFAAKAAELGAALVVVEEAQVERVQNAMASELGPSVVAVADTLLAWGALARAHLRHLRRQTLAPRTVALTGSAGKTTTKELTAALLRTHGDTLATAGNLNNRVGAPAMAFCAEASHRYLVLELGMSLRGEIGALASVVEPDVAVIVNIGVAHAEGVGGTRADVAREKGAIFEALTPAGVAVANADCEVVLGQLARTNARHVVTFGRSERACYRLASRTRHPRGGSLVEVVRNGGDVLSAHVPMEGEAAAIDFAAALAAADAVVGSPLSEGHVASALANLSAVGGRGDVLRVGSNIVVIDDTYNANPTSVAAAIDSAAELAKAEGRRLVVVLGEMKELGAVAQREHVLIGEKAARVGAGIVVGCGGLARAIVDAASAGGAHGINASDVGEASRAVKGVVQEGDVVLVKASRSVGAEAVVRALVEAFSPREETK